MTEYVLKQDIELDMYDDDGFSTGEVGYVDAGQVFQVSDGPFRIVGGPDTVHLESDDGFWMEITLERFAEWFEPVGGDRDG